MDNVLLSHEGNLIQDVGYFWDHSDWHVKAVLRVDDAERLVDANVETDVGDAGLLADASQAVPLAAARRRRGRNEQTTHQGNAVEKSAH